MDEARLQMNWHLLFNLIITIYLTWKIVRFLDKLDAPHEHNDPY